MGAAKIIPIDAWVVDSCNRKCGIPVSGFCANGASFFFFSFFLGVSPAPQIIPEIACYNVGVLLAWAVITEKVRICVISITWREGVRTYLCRETDMFPLCIVITYLKVKYRALRLEYPIK